MHGELPVASHPSPQVAETLDLGRVPQGCPAEDFSGGLESTRDLLVMWAGVTCPKLIIASTQKGQVWGSVTDFILIEVREMEPSLELGVAVHS